jgi:hypothetical protein
MTSQPEGKEVIIVLMVIHRIDQPDSDKDEYHHHDWKYYDQPTLTQFLDSFHIRPVSYPDD